MIHPSIYPFMEITVKYFDGYFKNLLLYFYRQVILIIFEHLITPLFWGGPCLNIGYINRQ